VSTSFLLGSDNTPSYMIELMYRMKVRDVMTKNLQQGTRKTTLTKLQEIMRDNNITGIPIAENGRLYGIISMDDIIKALQMGWMDDPAEKRMTKNVISLEDDMPLSFAINYLEKYHFGRFPVLTKTGQLVGILTSRDIIVHLLIAMNKELEALESKMEKKSNIDTHETLFREYSTRKFDFENAGKASTEIKKILMDKGLGPKLARRVAVASYELEMNQVCHSLGGTLSFKLTDGCAEIIAQDTGPGIEDLDAALEEGWSTANEWVRSLGFGAGMGLPNTKRVSDEFTITSSPSGTRVQTKFRLTENSSNQKGC
jgi:CBS domain-containing protein/anti-sigma regulatory factor (Ser/Thr protein kinase)